MSNDARKKTTSGEILNLMQVNAQSVLQFAILGHVLWSGPLQILLVFVLAWFYIGWSMLAGLVVFLLAVPYNLFISSRYNKFESRNIEFKDARVKIINEIFNGIKVQ